MKSRLARSQKKFRQLMRGLLLSVLPKKYSQAWIRNLLDLRVPRANSKLSFEIVSNAEDLRVALELVQRNYEREGYTQKIPGALRLTPYHLLPTTVVIVAKLESKIIATMSIIPRTSFGIPLDGSFSLETFANDKGKIVELSALAVDPSVRGQQGEVLYNLMKYMYHCNVDILDANTEVIGVNPKMRPLYEAVLLFQRIPGAKVVDYDFANGAPVVPMYFSLDGAFDSYQKVYSGKPAHQNVMDFFLLKPPPEFNLPASNELDQILPQRRATELKQIIGWNPSVLQSLPFEQQKIIVDSYSPWPECKNVLSEVARGK